MERKLTLRDVLIHIDGRFDALEKRTAALERRFDSMGIDLRTLNLKVDDNTRDLHSIREKTGRTEFMIYNMQNTRLEIHAKFPIENPEE